MTTSTLSRAPAADDTAAGLAVWTRGLTKRYGDRTVVDHLDLTLRRALPDWFTLSTFASVPRPRREPARVP